MPSKVRTTVKRIVPGRLWITARRATSLLRRLRIWRAVLKEVVGVTSADSAMIRRSASLGLRAALHDLDTWHDPVLVDDADVRLDGIGEFGIRGHSDDLFAVLPSRERNVVAAFKRHLALGSTFVDAGANIGFFTVLAARLVGPTGRVIAIEMMPDTATRLRANVERNRLGNVVIFEHALSNRSDEEVVARMPEHQFARASIVKAATLGEREIRVRTRTMDDLLADIPGPIDLIKMDLEGAELPALEGARAVLARTKRVIFEQLKDAAAGNYLESKGFRLARIDATNLLAERA